MTKIGFLYTGDWSREFRAFVGKDVPAHRLFGAGQMSASGKEAVHCSWGPLPRRLRHPHVWKIWQTLWVLTSQVSTAAYVCTTESPAFLPLLLRRAGILRRPVLVMSVALLRPSYQHGWRRRVIRFVMGSADMVFVYASSQVEPTRASFGLLASRVAYLPLGVDVDYFAPEKAPVEQSIDILSVGTNEGKDFPTLVAALPPSRECMIVTDDPNEQLIRAIPAPPNVHVETHVPITELRRRYASAAITVIPLRESPISSGQTVILEHLALGRRVITSDVSSIRDYVSAPGVTLFPPGDHVALAKLLAEGDTEAESSPAEISGYVREKFSSAEYSRRLSDAIDLLLAGDRTGVHPGG